MLSRNVCICFFLFKCVKPWTCAVEFWLNLFLVQSSDFVTKAVDVAVKELIAVASPGEGLPSFHGLNLFLDLKLMIPSSRFFCLFSTFYLKLEKRWALLFIFDAVDQGQLDRAKQATKSAILMNLESRVCKFSFSCIFLWWFWRIVVSAIIYWWNIRLNDVMVILQMVTSEDIGKQISTYGER